MCCLDEMELSENCICLKSNAIICENNGITLIVNYNVFILKMLYRKFASLICFFRLCLLLVQHFPCLNYWI